MNNLIVNRKNNIHNMINIRIKIQLEIIIVNLINK